MEYIFKYVIYFLGIPLSIILFLWCTTVWFHRHGMFLCVLYCPVTIFKWTKQHATQMHPRPIVFFLNYYLKKYEHALRISIVNIESWKSYNNQLLVDREWLEFSRLLFILTYNVNISQFGYKNRCETFSGVFQFPFPS